MTDSSAEYLRWSQSPALTPQQRQELCSLTDEGEIRDRFYRTLEFGTAGLRGLMGMGLNRMNEYIIRQATLAFARVILRSGMAEQGVCICYDCRIHSRFFAEEAANALRCCGIPVRMFRQCRPTPQLSFAVRHFGAAAGINVTASHNPKEYNGYKVYWHGGAQLPPEQAALVAAEMAQIDPLAPRPECAAPAPLTWLEEDFDRLYIDAVLQCAIDPALLRQDPSFKVIYSAFHGVGGFITPRVMEACGLRHFLPVPEQLWPDGTFPTVISPNPEDPRGFAMAMALARQENADVIVGTDPDSDRVGMVVRDRSGGYVPVSGNRTGVLLLNYLLEHGAERGVLPQNPCLIKTIVTTPLAQRIAESRGARCFNTFTGFKYMAEKLAELEQEGRYHYILAYEESYGYMIGDHARDKDGVVAAMLLCEMAAWYRSRGMTVLDGLEEIAARFGGYGEHTRNVMLPGEDGMNRMAHIMAALRQQPLTEIGGIPVSAWRDHLSGLRHTPEGQQPLELSGSNVVYYELSTGEALVIRPSGTEPKIKIYALMQGGTMAEADARAEACAQAAETAILAL